MIEKARELGMALAASPEFARVVEARKTAYADESLAKLMEEFKEKRDEVMDMMQSSDFDNDVIVAASEDMDRLQHQLFENPLFSELMIAEQEFQALVNSVNHEINKCIGVEDELEAKASCSGNCDNCSGCLS